ncbi:MAG: hypothetical protein J5I65_05955 [Aridibacter famidurans]|nr:hypothetical protein [Aridibacter famidurans]
MKTTLLLIAFLLLAAAAFPQDAPSQPGKTERIEADTSKGFSYPYFLYIPPALREENAQKGIQTLLVVPNNTGKPIDGLEEHEKNVSSKMVQIAFVFGRLNVPVLVPVFPRPAKEWKIYTHALDRDSLTTDLEEYKRLDLQLAAMIRDARSKLKSEKLNIGDKVLMYGFSASAMFANRFAFLHPNLVKAAAVGSPGGWPIAPVEKYKDKELRYPLGIGDVKALTGKGVDMEKLAKVSFLFFLGGDDDNDSLVFRDGYEQEDEDLALPLLGKKPVDRWPVSKELYEQAKMNAEFKLYPGEGHRPSRQMVEDVMAFLEKNKY